MRGKGSQGMVRSRFFAFAWEKKAPGSGNPARGKSRRSVCLPSRLPCCRACGSLARGRQEALLSAFPCGRSAAGGEASAVSRRRCSGRGQKTLHGKTSDGVQGAFRAEALGIRRAERARPGAGFRSVKTFGLRRRCGLRDHRKGRYSETWAVRAACGTSATGESLSVRCGPCSLGGSGGRKSLRGA